MLPAPLGHAAHYEPGEASPSGARGTMLRYACPSHRPWGRAGRRCRSRAPRAARRREELLVARPPRSDRRAARAPRRGVRVSPAGDRGRDELRAAAQARRVRGVRLPCRLRRRARRGRPRRDPLLLLRALPGHRAARRLPRFRRGAGAPRAPSRPAPRASPCPLPGRRRAGRQLLPAPELVRRVHRCRGGGDLHPARSGAAAPHLPDEASSREPEAGHRAGARPRGEYRQRGRSSCRVHRPSRNGRFATCTTT